MFSWGVKIGIIYDHNLLQDIKELKPTILPAVPRILNKIFDGI